MPRLRQLWQSLLDSLDATTTSDSPTIDVSLEHSWPWPSWTAALLWIVCSAAVIRLYLTDPTCPSRQRRMLLAGLRLALVSLVVFMMHGWVVHQYRVDLPDLVVAIDDSQSMAFEDRFNDPTVELAAMHLTGRAGFGTTSRWNQALSLLREDGGGWLDALQTRFRVKAYRAGGTARRITGEPQEWVEQLSSESPQEESSHLGDGVAKMLVAQRGRPTAAILFLTDGITTGGKTLSDVAELARRQAVPLFLVGIGDDLPPRDIRLSDLLVDDATFVGDVLSFDAKIQHDGFPGQRVTVQLLDAEQQQLDEQQVTLNDFGGPQPIQLSYRPRQVGTQEFYVDVIPQLGESSSDNNRLVQRVLVRDEQIRVLLVDSEPSYEFRTLKHLLNRVIREETGEPVIDLTTLLQSADFEIADQDETAIRVFPLSRDELFAYDVLIFGDVDATELTSTTLDRIAEFVTLRGGGIVFIAGPRFNPVAYRGTRLESLFPISLADVATPPATAVLTEPFSVATTPLGRASPHLQLGESLTQSDNIWRALPPLYWLCSARELKPAARLLVEQQQEGLAARDSVPLITMQFVGAGKVVFHATDETYRWAQHRGDDRYYSRYWLQLIRYLSRAKLLSSGEPAEIFTDRDKYRHGDAVRIRVRLRNVGLSRTPPSAVRVVLESELGRRREVVLQPDPLEPNAFRGFVDDLDSGRHRVWLVAPQFTSSPAVKHFEIEPRDGEQARLEMLAGDLQQAARISGGRFYRIHEALRLLDEIPAGRRIRVEALTPDPLWNSGWLAAAFVGLLTTEWLLRRRYGMI